MPGESILVSDDSAEIRNTLADYLRSAGYRVQTAADGRKAVTLINSQPFDLVITDLQMPFVDGLGVLQAVKACNSDIPVIILTGHPTIESAIGALREGAYNYLLKPVENLDELHHVVQNALSHRRLTLENRRLLEELRVLNASLAQRVAQQTEQLREAYEQLKSLDQMKAEFISVTSHELRTPLAQMFFTADLLQEQLNRGSIQGAKAYLADMMAQSQRLRRQIDNLFDFSQLDRNEFKLELGLCSVLELVNSTVELWRLRIEKKKLRLEVALPHQDLVLTADMPRVQHALGQLLDNAIKFTPPGGRVRVAAHWPAAPPWTQPIPSSFAVIAVIDSGPGIPNEKQHAIFQVFTQADMSDQRRYGGLGMGLTIASKIILAHGGRITLNSEPGKGSMFAIWLPMNVTTSSASIPG